MTGNPVRVSRARLAQAIAAAVDTVRGAHRSGGSGVEVATQHRGGKVVGVGVYDDQVLVQIVAERLPLDRLIDEVRTAACGALAEVGDRRPLAVSVADLDIDRLPDRRVR